MHLEDHTGHDGGSPEQVSHKNKDIFSGSGSYRCAIPYIVYPGSFDENLGEA